MITQFPRQNIKLRSSPTLDLKDVRAASLFNKAFRTRARACNARASLVSPDALISARLVWLVRACAPGVQSPRPVIFEKRALTIE